MGDRMRKGRRQENETKTATLLRTTLPDGCALLPPLCGGLAFIGRQKSRSESLFIADNAVHVDDVIIHEAISGAAAEGEHWCL